MKAPRFQSWLHLPSFKPEKVDSKSLTKAPKSMSISELVQRNLGHLIEKPSVEREPQYFGGMLMPDLSRLDIVDLRQYQKSVQADIDAKTEQLKDIHQQQDNIVRKVNRDEKTKFESYAKKLWNPSQPTTD